jgi:molybdate/tungstate transport system ATP-binding protein
MIRIDNLSLTVGEFSLKGINLEVTAGEFFVIIGPTGAGKTVLLESVAGLIKTRRGRILVEGRDISALPPETRGVGIVYQDSSLFPHLTVRENILYGLRYRPKSAGEEEIEKLVAVLGLGKLLDRFPGNLSGGERQKTALARALAVRPSILLLDEPLNALDPHFRGEIQLMLENLHRQSGITFLMVTHNFNEALALAHRGAVINNGRIEQTGEITRIFQEPASEFVARFVGIKNLFPAEFRGTRAMVRSAVIETTRKQERENGFVAIRPEEIVLSRESIESSMRNSFPGRVTAVIPRGLFYEVTALCGDLSLTALITRGALQELAIAPDSSLYLSFKSAAVHTF